eukprot:5646969-Alexandrium_andersonii.AAC.1
MSASLVGSEMCIRDRGLDLNGPKAVPAAMLCSLGFPTRRRPEVQQKGIACLLYTSDAADDM